MDRLLHSEQDNKRILLNLLTSVHQNGEQSQRHIAAELGVALGLVNVYLKRCIKKGLVKVHNAPARRYVYYLTPTGFAEKSRLTIQYLSDSFSFFRLAKEDCARALATARTNNFNRVVLAGRSDLAEIAILCAAELAVTVVAVVDRGGEGSKFAGVDLIRSYADILGEFDAVLVTDLTDAQAAFDDAVAACGADRVMVPALLGLRSSAETGSHA
ncbi:winged helix-turn-helix transcriptional regulator [Bradyrhizobium murdochi]|uniref:winged helix-turn-helix transcriptional regulator n=1 Tax=Bradyrhizobium murdochi TaxID=1038859 RepID=UPI0003FFA42E|nr:winged helix-turn-helix transcriptional regulator [Bradyrhizobium murdochi]